MSSENKITVLIVEPLKPPRISEIPETLEAMQSVVGGKIQEIMPFDDEVAIVCNDEGKISGMELCRALYGDNGEIIDIIAGSFFVCSAPFDSENFESLTASQQRKYSEIFRTPEVFLRTESGIKVLPVPTKTMDYER